MQRDAFRGSTHPSARFSREELRPPAAKLRLLGAALALVYCAPAAAAQSLNIDLGTYYGTPPATYGAASGQAGTWNEAGLGLTALVDLSGGSTGSSVTVVADSPTGGTVTNPTNDDGLLLRDNFYVSNAGTWTVDVSGLAPGDYRIFLYASSNSATPTGNMLVEGVGVPSLFGDWDAVLIEGVSWAQVAVPITDGTLNISGADTAASGLAGVQIVPYLRGVNIDFGTGYGVPTQAFRGGSGQPGVWNEAGLGSTALVDLAGLPSSVSVNVVAESDLGGVTGNPTWDNELLLEDNIFTSGGLGWSVDLSGLDPGPYVLFLYAPTNSVTPTGSMLAGGAALGSIPGHASSVVLEGTSWARVGVTVTDGTLAISGVAAPYSGLAGLQLVPFTPAALNIDFGTGYGIPDARYGAASSQAGAWNQAGLGVTSFLDPAGAALGLSVTVDAASDYIPAFGAQTDDELLLVDGFYSVNGDPWSVDVAGLSPGLYDVYLYAPSDPGAPTGSMLVGGVPVASVPGDPGSSLIEGTSWTHVQVAVTGNSLGITGSGGAFAGLAALQLVPLAPAALNVDFGTAYGTPSAGYGAASGQSGTWSLGDVGVHEVIDLAGLATPASMTVVAGFPHGNSGPPADDDGLLLNDNFFTPSGGGWTVAFAGLAAGSYEVLLYAPSNGVVPTGAMSVGGIPVPSLPGSPSSTLIEYLSWVRVPVTVLDGTLTITGSGGGSTGLAGLQLQPVPVFTTYCSAGVSASGCSASLSGFGTPSASASSGFELRAAGVEGAKDGLFFLGTSGRQANSWGNGTSFQCVVPPVKRAGLLMGSGMVGACDGAFAQDIAARWSSYPAQNPGAGAVVQGQLWYRDPWNTSNQTTSLSDAIEFTVQP